MSQIVTIFRFLCLACLCTFPGGTLGKAQRNHHELTASGGNSFTDILASSAGGNSRSPGGGIVILASFGESCETSPCVRTNGLTCDPGTRRCRCLDSTNFIKPRPPGTDLFMEWSFGKCMSKLNSICSTKLVGVGDGLGFQFNCVDYNDCILLPGYEHDGMGTCKLAVTTTRRGNTASVGIATSSALVILATGFLQILKF